MMRTLWRQFLAFFRLSLRIVCEESRGMGVADYHDYPDTAECDPTHFGEMVCQRCGKRFVV